MRVIGTSDLHLETMLAISNQAIVRQRIHEREALRLRGREAKQDKPRKARKCTTQ